MEIRQKILIVDDERLNINVLADLLKPNYKIMAAINGKQALKAARSDSPPDLILLDVMMPEMDGHEVCRLLKSDEKTRDIPIIFVTAMGLEDDETKGLNLGAADYLTKPISPAIVEARVRTQLALKKHMEDLHKAYAIIESQKDRMQAELNVGRDIQLAMVPKDFPLSSDFSVHAILEPAREVGGDFYDVFKIDDEHICFCVGDVSGKGVPAALFMAMAKTLIKSRAASDLSTASIVTHINNELSKDNETCLFVTLFVCILNTRTGDLLTTNAGHNPPYLKRPDGSITTLSYLDGPVAAAVSEYIYTEQHVQLTEGDTLLLFTDGVTEADDIDGTLFGNERLEKLFQDWKGGSINELTTHIVKTTHEYEGADRQADDITVLAIGYHGHEAIDINGFEIKLDNRLENINRVNDKFTEFATDKGFPDKIIGIICVAFDELLTNIISYAFEDDKQHQITIQVSTENDSVIIVIKDDGIPFNPLEREAPDTSIPLEDREIGGLGIHLVNNIIDKVSYQRQSNENVVTLVKYLTPEQ